MRLRDSSTVSDAMDVAPSLTQRYVHPGVSYSPPPATTPDEEQDTFELAIGQRDKLGKSDD